MKLVVGVVLMLLLLCNGVSTRASDVSSDTQDEIQADGILSSVVDHLWSQTDDYFHDGDFPRIVALMRIIVSIDPHFVDAFNTGAWIMWSMGDDNDATAFYQQDVQSNPLDSDAYYDYGFFLYNHLHNFPGAVAVFTADIANADAGILDYRMLAHSYEKEGRWDRALEVWRRIKARWPHGAPTDPSKGAIDDRNMLRAAKHLDPVIVPMIPAK
jgi:pentatricopeptide repeat protein